MNEALKSKYANHPLAQKILREGLAIQDRFSPEPIYSKSGKGYLKSARVDEIKEAKKAKEPQTYSNR